MGSLLCERQRLYTYRWIPHVPNDIYVEVTDLCSMPYPFHGKILIPYSQTHDKRDFIAHNHHRVILINDYREL
jgi:hypothetical protein